MTYNPTLQRWEGNESILREFDKVLSTSTRPALISPFSSTLGSPARSGFSSPTLLPTDSITSHLDPTPIAQPSKPQAASRGGVKVVGDMVFDPATCSWHALSGPDAEDELDLDWGEVADDEEGGEGDGWEKGERERMLKNRASFVLSEGEEGSSEEEGKKGKMTKRGIWRESKRAEERCKQEMKSWIVREEEGEKEDRSWLYELRAVRAFLLESLFNAADPSLDLSAAYNGLSIATGLVFAWVCFSVSFALSFVVSTLFRNFRSASFLRLDFLPYFVITLFCAVPLAIKIPF